MAPENSSIFIGNKSRTALLSFIKRKRYSSCFIICDSNTLKHCLSKLILSCSLLKEAEIIELEPGEETKDISVITNIWQTLADFGANKTSLVINLGGGVVSDTGGFAASTFKRGIDFINIPTTLLAIADASIGGKTGINFSGAKNLIGTITQPKAIFINPDYLKTLPVRHSINGIAEIIKIALIKDKKFFSELCGLKSYKDFQSLPVIIKSIELKQGVVKKDPNEKGLRKILNFGHTIGHAVESLFLEKPEPLLHGEAIATGMVIESYLCYLLKRISKKELDLIIKCIGTHFKFYTLDKSNLDTFYKFFGQDKKHTGSLYMFALLNGTGKCDHEVKVNRTLIDKAIEYYNTHIANVA